MKRRLRVGGRHKPFDELSLDTAIDESVQHIWNQFEWSFKKKVGTFTPTAATYELPADVDTILEITYGDNNRVVEPLPSWWVNELYDNTARTGSVVYYYSLYSGTNDRLTIELTPAPSGDTFTYKYRRKIGYGDLNSIPSKLHGLVLLGARTFLKTGVVQGNPAFDAAIGTAIVQDQPIKHKRSAMGLDNLIASRVRHRNNMIYGGTSQDTSRPID